MNDLQFPPLPLVMWQPTRDTVQGYAQVLGKIRGALAPPQKHWWHVSLRIWARGLTTTPLPAGDRVVELSLDVIDHTLRLYSSQGDAARVALRGQSTAVFYDEVTAVLADWGVRPAVDRAAFSESVGHYEATAVARFWSALVPIDAIFKEFKAGFRGESSPVQLWPHHFDLALLWLSGRRVPDQNPNDPEYADEQMNFGFVTGDATIPEPYFYATAYPSPAGFTAATLPEGAYWHRGRWEGAILPYVELVRAARPKEMLLTFLQTAQAAGAALMT